MIILNGQHLHRILTEYVEYYNESRTHLSLDGDSPVGREVEDPDKVVVGRDGLEAPLRSANQSLESLAHAEFASVWELSEHGESGLAFD